MATCPSCASENPEGSKFCNECGARLGALPVREERKVISALFCDLVGSTALGEAMDHEDVAHLLADYQAICRRLIESHGGVVEKFIGDAVVGVFGVPSAHEDDPERAVRAALRIVEEIEASELGLQVRVGVNTGEALVRLDVDPRSGEGFATGDSLNTAARLEAAAPVMGVAVGEPTHAGTAHAIVYEPMEPVSAKGKAEPVAAFRALHPVARVGNPERDRTPFVGRDLELSVLSQLFERARTRRSVGFATIVAEPGLGKSRLVRELGRYVDALPELVTWREGRCLPYGEGISFWALGEIVKAQAGILETDDQDTLSGKLEAVISEPDPQLRVWLKDRVAPLVGLQTQTAPPEQQEAFTAWRTFLEQLAQKAPTVLVVEDLHWADDAFVAFLRHLVERSAGVPLLVIVTARPEVEERHPSWPPGRGSTMLSLSPLDDAELAELVAATFEGATDELTRIVLERAGGSPLFAEQLAAMLAEQQMPIAGGAVDASAIPTSVQALIAARIDQLPPEPKRVLMEASVVGRSFWSGAVGSLGEHADLEASLAELTRRELCRPVAPSTMEGEREFAFWHALVRDVCYAELTRVERARMHAATARWIAGRAGAALGEDSEIVLAHLDAARELGSTEDLGDLVRTALVAAGRSAMRIDVARALELHERALTMLADDDPARTEVAHALGLALASRGGFARAAQVLEPLIQRLLDADDLEGAVRVAIDLNGFLWETGEGARGDAFVRGLGDRLEGRESPAVAELLAWEAQVAAVERRWEEAARFARRSIAMADSLAIPAPGRALMCLGMSLLAAGDPGGEALCRQASALALAQGHVREATTSLMNMADRLVRFASPERALAVLDEVVDLAERVGVVAEVWVGRLAKLECEAAIGRFDEVVDGMPPILAWAEAHGDTFVRMSALSVLARVEVLRGEGAVEPVVLADLARAMGSKGELIICALLALEGGDETGATAWLHEALPHLDPVMVDSYSTVAVRLGEADLVRDLVEHGSAKTPGGRASHLAASAVLAEHDGDLGLARDRYRDAEEVFGRMGMLPDRARALTGLGRCLLGLGAIDEAVRALTEARELWIGMKATPRIAEIDVLLSVTT